MPTLQAMFPAHDFTLLAIIVALPLIGAFVNGVFGKRLGKDAVTLMALIAVGVPFLASVVTFLALKNAPASEQAARLVWKGWEWFHVSARGDDASVPISVTFSVDALSSVMILVITGVGFLIHLYSTSYMAEDAGYHRFFAYLNLFVFSMLVLVLGDSLPVLFVGWEGVGLCSYLLIGFWFQEDANAAAGKKAFIANRIGDFGLLVAMSLLVYHVGALDWAGINAGAQNLLKPQQVWPIGTHVPLAGLLPHDAALWLNAPRYVSVATLVGLALFLGAAGKSAQIPLYVWLPDAMAGPTPVSALIHAATMVTAGVYLVCRTSAVFVLSPAAMFTVAFIGACTALFAATIALVQNDIKKVLAYSTVSQLGYMFLGVGVGAFSSGFFHVVTHAFFKACLFLGAGSVIHAMHARIHGTDPSQDLRNMGGLKAWLPTTFFTFAAAWAAIVGFPGTAGFFSKDEILFKAYTSQIKPPLDGKMPLDHGEVLELFTWPSWGGTTLYTMGVLTALLTAFYMSRLVIGIFFGEFKGWTIVPGYVAPEHEHGHDSAHAAAPEEEDEEREGPTPHESPWQITVPLVVLGGLSLVAGFLNAHAVLHGHLFDDWMKPVFEAAEKVGVIEVEGAETKEMILLLPGLAAFLGGVGGAYWVYMMQNGEPARELAERLPGLHRLVYEKWRVDEIYEETFIGAVDSLAEFSVWFDKWIVDGIVAHVTAFLVMAAGTLLRQLQTGRAHAYAAVMVVGVGGLGWFFAAAHPTTTVERDDAAGTYKITAAPGLGYEYRWSAEGEQPPEFGSQASYELQIAQAGESKKVKLEVRNAFGNVAARDLLIERPKPDLSGAGNSNVNVEIGADGQMRARPAGNPNVLQPARPMGGAP